MTSRADVAALTVIRIIFVLSKGGTPVIFFWCAMVAAMNESALAALVI